MTLGGGQLNQYQYLFSSHGTRWAIGPGLPGADDRLARWISAEQILRVEDNVSLNRRIPDHVTLAASTRIPHGCPADVERNSWHAPPRCCTTPVLCGGGTAYASRIGGFTEVMGTGHQGLPYFRNRYNSILHYSPRFSAWVVSSQVPDANISVVEDEDLAFRADFGHIAAADGRLLLGSDLSTYKKQK